MASFIIVFVRRPKHPQDKEMEIGKARHLHDFQALFTLHENQADALEALKHPAQRRSLSSAF